MMGCNSCGSPITRSDNYCPSCGHKVGAPKAEKPEMAGARCSRPGCDADADFRVGTLRCWTHYCEDIDRTPHMDWREQAIRAEYKRLGLTRGRKGETLSEYMARNGVQKNSLRLYERVPGSDDE